MNCLSCGQEIPEHLRMCQECAKKMVDRIIAKKQEHRMYSERRESFVWPEDAPKGVVRAWKPKHTREAQTGFGPQTSSSAA